VPKNADCECFEEKCLNYGLKEETPAFTGCFMQEVRTEEEKRLGMREGWRDYVNCQWKLEFARAR